MPRTIIFIEYVLKVPGRFVGRAGGRLCQNQVLTTIVLVRYQSYKATSMQVRLSRLKADNFLLRGAKGKNNSFRIKY